MITSEIRDRVLTVLELRTMLPQHEVSTVDAKHLLSLALCSNAHLPNRVIYTDRNHPRNSQRPPSPENKARVAQALFQLIPMDALDSLSAFEFSALASCALIDSQFSNIQALPEIGRVALVLAGVASPMTHRRLFTTPWVEAIQSLVDKSKTPISPEHLNIINSFFTFHRRYVSPNILTYAAKLLKLDPAVFPPASTTELMDTEVLPRTLWGSSSIGKLPRWAGKVPKIKKQNSTTSSKFPTSFHSVAIVIPFHDGELAKIQHTLKILSKTKKMSGLANKKTIPLILALNADFDTHTGRVLEDAILTIWKAHTPSNLELYLLSLRQPPNTNHYDGAAFSFFQLQWFLGDYFDAMQLMETDMFPIQSNWIDKLAKEAQGACSAWWMKGSSQQCAPALNQHTDQRVDFHINGNSLYALNCNGFDNYIRRTQAFYTPQFMYGGQCQMIGGCETGRAYEGGYDHVLYRYRQDPLTYHYSRNILSHFTYTPNILNFCEEQYNATKILTKNSQAFLVHSKFQMYSKYQRVVLDVYNSMLLRQPSPQEAFERWKKLTFRITTEAEFVNSICTSAEYIGLSKLGMNATKCKHNITHPNITTDQHTNQIIKTTTSVDKLGTGAPHSITRDETGFETILAEREQPEGLEPPTPIQLPSSIYIRAEEMDQTALTCLMPVLSDLKVVIRSSSSASVCNDFGDCGGEQKKIDELTITDDMNIDFVICSNNVEKCSNILRSDAQKMLFVLSMSAVIEARKKDGVGTVQEWDLSLQRLCEHKGVSVIASDKAAQLYIQTLTSQHVRLAPWWCGDSGYNHRSMLHGGHSSNIEPSYLPARNDILVAGSEKMGEAEENRIKSAIESTTNNKYTLASIRNVYPDGGNDFSVVRHPAIVFLHGLVLSLDFTRFYRLGIPIFVPTVEYYLHLYSGDLHSTLSVLDDTKTQWAEKILEISKWEGVQQFQSEEDLVAKLNACDFQRVSETMRNNRQHTYQEIKSAWQNVIMDVIGISKHKSF